MSRRRWERAREIKLISIYVYMYRRSIETRQDETNKENGGQRERYSAVGYVATDCDKEEEEE